MTENLKTIREFAEELGVSKQRIQQIIAKLSTSKMPNKEGNRYVLNKKDMHNIKVLMGIENDNYSTSKTSNRVVDYDTYLDVIDSLKEKDEQIKGLLEVQKQTQKLLDQSQQLQLIAEKKIEALQQPAPPKEEQKEKPTSVDKISKKRQWWRFN
jgi:hypothetical protein